MYIISKLSTFFINKQYKDALSLQRQINPLLIRLSLSLLQPTTLLLLLPLTLSFFQVTSFQMNY